MLDRFLQEQLNKHLMLHVGLYKFMHLKCIQAGLVVTQGTVYCCAEYCREFYYNFIIVLLVAYLLTLGCKKRGRFSGISVEWPTLNVPNQYNASPQINGINTRM